MNSITNEIVAIKMEVRKRNWKELNWECQQSGLSMKEWCKQNGIHPSTYYARLRRLREKFEAPRGFIEKLEEYIHYYKNERILLKLKGMSPVHYRAHLPMI